MRSTIPALLVVLGVAGCKGDPLDPNDTVLDTSVFDTADTDIGPDTDEDTEDDTTPFATDAPDGFAFCAGGGRINGGAYTGTVCVAPLDVVSEPVTSGSYTWQPGPIYVLDPS